MECVSLLAWQFLFVCVLCQPVHSLSHPYISYRFLFRNLFMETCFCSFLIALYKVQQHCSTIINSSAHVPAVMIIASLHGQIYAQLKWRLALQHIALRSLEAVQHRLYYCFKLSTIEPSLGNILTIDGCFNCFTFCVKMLGWLKKKERKNIILVFNRFGQTTLEQFLDTLSATVD